MNSSQMFRFIRLGLITLIGFLISLLAVVLMSPLILLFWTISKIVYFCIGLKLGNTFTRPNGMDIIQGMENHRSRPFINTVARFEGKIDMDKFCQKFDEQILKLKDKNGNLKYKKFTQTYEKVYGYHVFRDVKDFDIRKQIRKVSIEDIFPEKFIHSNNYVCEETSHPNKKEYSMSPNGSRDCEEIPFIEWETLVERAMQKFGSQPIPPGCPKWEILLIEESQHYTMVFRIFHSYCDGVYFLRFLLQHIGDEPVECKLPYNYHEPNRVRRFMDYLWAFCLLPYGLFRLSFTYEKNPLHGPKLSGDKMFLISKPIPLQTLKEIKRESKTTMNAIFFSCLSNAVATHFQKKKSNVKNIIALVPISLQDLEKPIKLKNRFAMIGILLPTFLDQNSRRNPSSALERLQEVQASCDRSRDDPSFLAIHWLLVFICSLLPSSLLNTLFTSKGLTTSMSNVVGPQETDFYFTGARKTEILFWIPDRSPLGMGVSVIGFAGKVRVGLMIDKNLMNTSQEGYDFIDAFIEEIHNLHKEVLPANQGPSPMVMVMDIAEDKETIGECTDISIRNIP